MKTDVDKKLAQTTSFTTSMKRDIVNMLLGNVATGLVMTYIAFTGLVFGINNEETRQTKMLFWYVMNTIVIFRFLDWLYWHFSLKQKHFSPQPVFLRFCIASIFTAVMWALYAVSLYHTMDTIELAATMVVLAAMAGGAATVLAPSRLLVSVYCTALLVPTSLRALYDNESQFVILGALGLCFWIGIFSSAFRYNRFFVDTVILKDQKEKLLKEMNEKQRETFRINDELLKANNSLDQANASLEEQVERRTSDILRLSNRDSLTNLLNRNGFLKHVNSQIKKASTLNNQLALLFIDLDGFKQVNDSLGHKVGDSVLAEIAKRLTKFCESGHLARWGGDEFVATVPYATEDTALAVAQAMRGGITVPITALENEITLDATIGISMYPHHGIDAQTLIQHADLTMYEQKRKQRGSIGVFSESLHTDIKTEQQLCENLRTAIDKKTFSVHYQPIIDANTGKTVKVEALLRWNCNGVSISPAQFIPLVEKIGIMPEVGIWVLNRACIDVMQWNTDTDLALSVNVSICQLTKGNFEKATKNALISSGITPDRLHLEITESVFADEEDNVGEQITALKRLGVNISIDDFGTGFSSLSRLQSLACDFIKIDRSFVQNTNEESDTILRATMLIANEFGCKTVAEGIETVEHVERVKQLGVNYLQGFYYAKPMAASDFISWYNKNN
ncbi:EAL domain-containing protein [Alteromonas sp.]|nr:EAL domain-containing protein [Alteromonas sp.]